jgi:hypothetical protein
MINFNSTKHAKVHNIKTKGINEKQETLNSPKDAVNNMSIPPLYLA